MRFLFTCVAVGVLVAGCSSPPHRHFDSQASFPAASTLSPEKESDARPEEVPGDNPWIGLNLPTVLELVGAHDLQIAFARERLAELKAKEDQAKYRFFPSLLPGASFQRLDGHYQETRGDFLDSSSGRAHRAEPSRAGREG